MAWTLKGFSLWNIIKKRRFLIVKRDTEYLRFNRDIKIRTIRDRNNLSRVDLSVRHVVMTLDM
jgi:hypothetical protein